MDLVILALLLVPSTLSPEPQDGYRLPPREIVEILDAPVTPSVLISPDSEWMLLIETPSMPSIAEVARPWVGLAGVRIDTTVPAAMRSSFSAAISVRDRGGETEYELELPDPARIANLRWSHDSRMFAFTRIGDESVELWVADVVHGEAERVARGVNSVLGPGFGWMPDGRSLWCLLFPSEQGEAPERPAAPAGPAAQETSGTRSPLRTYTDLLEDSFDEELFAYYASAQLALVDVVNGEVRRIGPAGLLRRAEPSPDGQRFLVERIERPFSYLLPYRSFAHSIEVWSAEGKLEHLVAEVPPAENIPIGGVRTGPRNVQWKATADASLVWTAALDGGDPKREAEFRDRWLILDAPFTGDPKQLLRLEQRARGLTWMADPNQFMATQYDRDRRWTKTRLYDISKPDAEPVVLDDRSVRDRYANPGEVWMRTTERGTRIVRQDGAWIYRTGPGDSPAGARPYLHRQNIETLETQRLWRSAPGCYESVEAMVETDPEGKLVFMTVYESPTEPPNWRLRQLDNNQITSLTEFDDPTPQLRGIQKQLLTYEREDGVQLSATLYLPRDYEAGTRLPLLVWAYPIEFNDPRTAGQIAGSPFRFTRIRGASHLFFLTQGYAIMDRATMPIVGDPETMNDTFIEQIVASARAAIDEAVELGVADRDRVGVGGHSYGAFMTANLLAHCDLFQAGIARSGAYNRTLTPFGFQSERRTLWEAPEVYFEISPFMHADCINEPLLLIHGEKDSNSGTYPIQSERLFQAIKGHGGRARHVVLPGEGHGYEARESVLHTLHEMVEWFDQHVKHPTDAAVEAGAGR
jgi:dipeptidyl aminopeptidase/acylaminoacyl peptidase